MASQIERERVAESTARYHHEQWLRWLDLWSDLDLDESEASEIRRRFTYHYREARAAEVRELAIQLEDFDARDLVRLCRRAA